MDRKPGPFDTVGISGREYNKITDENAALRAELAALKKAVAKMRHANNKDRWDALEWIAACAEVDRLLGASA